MSLFGFNFGQNADVDIILDGQDERKMAEIKDENGRKERHYLFFDGESVTGRVNVTLHRKTNRLEHQGIKIEFIGQIELYYDRGNHHEFLSLVKQLAGPGDLTQNTSFDFEFNQVEKPYECYTGANVRLRYFLRVTIGRRITDMTKEMDILVHTLATYPEMNNPIKMEVGIEECLHIEFEYNKSKYHLKDVIVGKIYFLLVRIKIKHMEVAIIKRETTGSGPNTFHDNETIAKYEIMDGAPVKGESIPIRVFLAGYDLTPTMRDINKKFSVKYYLNLVLVDEEERRYFKQQEITLWRKGERVRKGHGQMSAANSMYQMPHAMARHEGGGDLPSANIRTAPTPSEPNTPAALAAATGGGASAVPIPGPASALHAPDGGGLDSISTIGRPLAQNGDAGEPDPNQIPGGAGEEIPQNDTRPPGSDADSVVPTPVTEKVDDETEPTEEHASTVKNPVPIEHPGEVSGTITESTRAEIVENNESHITPSPAPPSPVASLESPHKFMESPPPMEDSVGGGADEDSAPEDIGELSDQSEDEMVETIAKTKAKKKQPEAVAT